MSDERPTTSDTRDQTPRRDARIEEHQTVSEGRAIRVTKLNVTTQHRSSMASAFRLGKSRSSSSD